MNFEDLKEQIKEQWESLVNSLEDNPTYNSVKEQFETLPANAQKGIIFGGLALILLLLFYIPLSYFNSADVYEKEYVEKKEVIRDLLNVSRIPKGRAPLPSGVTADNLLSRYKMALNEFNLTPEQFVGSKLLGKSDVLGIAKPPVLADGFLLEVKDLNLRQIVDIGYKLQGLQRNVKMLGVDIKATVADAHYFNVIYKFVNFSLPQEDEEEQPKKGKKSRRSKKSRIKGGK